MKKPKTRAASRSRRRIFIVDDHPITRRGLTELINSEADLEVCGDAEKAATALEKIKSLKPDLVLADITLPGRSGLTLIEDLQQYYPDLPALVLSMHDEEVFAERVLRAGGRGYVMKSEGGGVLLQAIRQVLTGKVYLSDNMSSRILNTFSSRRSQENRPVLSSLTDREFEVFQLIGQGLPTAEIGRRLHLSPKTVDTHRLHIREKLKMKSLPELIKFAVRWAATEEMI